MKYILKIKAKAGFTLLFFTLFASASFAAESTVLSPKDITALETIASRKGLARISYDARKGAFEVYAPSLANSFWRRITSQTRHDIMPPLENLATAVESGFKESFQKDKHLFTVLSQAFSSLTSLYGYYQINPTNSGDNQAFMKRFQDVLKRLNAVITDMQSDKSFKLAHFYKVLPWEYAVEGGTAYERNELGLHYLDMPRPVMDRAMKLIGNHHMSIRRALEFIPTERRALFKADLREIYGKKVVMFVIHGTYAKGSAEYGADTDPMFKQALYTAQSAANFLQAPVELYSIEWSGENDNHARMVAGEELARFFELFFPAEMYVDLWIGHSHGGNVIFSAAKSMRGKRTPYAVVTLATPIRSDFITDNLNYYFPFWNTADQVQYFGSYEITTRNSGTYISQQNPRTLMKADIIRSGIFTDSNMAEGVKVFSTEVLVNGRAPVGSIESHSVMKLLIGVLPAVLDRIVTSYKPNRNLILNLAPGFGRPEAMTVNQMEDLKFELMLSKQQPEPIYVREHQIDEEQRRIFRANYGAVPAQ